MKLNFIDIYKMATSLVGKSLLRAFLSISFIYPYWFYFLNTNRANSNYTVNELILPFCLSALLFYLLFTPSFHTCMSFFKAGKYTKPSIFIAMIFSMLFISTSIFISKINQHYINIDKTIAKHILISGTLIVAFSISIVSSIRLKKLIQTSFHNGNSDIKEKVVHVLKEIDATPEWAKNM